MLTTDPGTGVMRHADAGYERAVEVARERGVRIPLLDRRRALSDDRVARPPRLLPRQLPGARARSPPPSSLTGPPGAGKTTLLLRAADALAAAGWVPVYLDLMGAASSPERFVHAALAALPAERVRGARCREARPRIGSRRPDGQAEGAAAVQALFALWASLDDAGGRPVALLLDEATEIRSLAYFAGLREVDGPFGAASPRAARGTSSPPSYPTLARRLWPELESRSSPSPWPPPSSATLARRGLAADAAALARGLVRLAPLPRSLLGPLGRRPPLAAAWAAEMARGGAPRAGLPPHLRGAAAAQPRLRHVQGGAGARWPTEEGLNLTALVARLGRTPGAVRDYLGWLLGVDALRMRAQALLLRGRDGALVGAPARPRRDPRRAGRSPPRRASCSRRRGAAAVRVARTERLMEID